MRYKQSRTENQNHIAELSQFHTFLKLYIFLIHIIYLSFIIQRQLFSSVTPNTPIKSQTFITAAVNLLSLAKGLCCLRQTHALLSSLEEVPHPQTLMVDFFQCSVCFINNNNPCSGTATSTTRKRTRTKTATTILSDPERTETGLSSLHED
jgi:hypothetical protein